MNFNFSAEELATGTIVSPWGPTTGNKFRVSTNNACCGTKSFSSAGLGFWGTSPTRYYELSTPLFTSSVSNLNLTTVGFSYRITMPSYPGSTNIPPAAPPKWYFDVTLREYPDTGTGFTDYNISNGTVQNSGNTKDYQNPSVDGCAAFYETVNQALNLNYSYQIIIRFWTDNTNTAPQNYVTIDCIKTASNVLTDDVNEELNGLSEPTYSTSVGTGSVNTSGQLVADISLTKGAQSAVSCGTDTTQSSNTPHCALGGVKGIYYVEKVDKSTGEVISINDIDTFTIVYGSSSSTVFSKSAAVFEDALYTYNHIFGYEVWSTENDYDVKMAYTLLTPPAKPSRTLTVNYYGGGFTINLNGPLIGTATVTGLDVKGYSNNLCTTHIESHYLSGSLTIYPGSTSAVDGGGGLTCNCLRRKLTNGATINGTGLSSGQTINIDGQTVTLSIVSSCVPYAC